MQNTVVLLLLIVTATFINKGCSQGLAGTVLSSSEEIENITVEYYHALQTQFSDQWLFPSIRFSTNGTIIGWRFAASAHDEGGARPRLSVWTPEAPGSDIYNIRDSALTQQCVTSEVTLDSGETARFYSGGPTTGTTGITFNEGDILGIFFRRLRIASFVPYLYNTSIINPFQDQESPPLAYFVHARSQKDRLSLQDISVATMLPLLVLDLCVVSPDDELQAIQVCMGNDTVDWEMECEKEEPSTTTHETTSYEHLMTNQTITADNSDELRLIAVIAAPAGVVFLLAACLLVVMISCCICKIKNKERKSTHTITDDIHLETIADNGSVTVSGGHTYDTPDQVRRRSTFLVSITNEIYDGNSGTNGQPERGPHSNGYRGNQTSVATYEEPIFSQSQHEPVSSERHGYDVIKHMNGNLKVGNSSPRSRTPLPGLPLPYGSHQLSPLMPHTPLPPSTPTTTTTTFYHSLEAGFNTSPLGPVLGLSSTVTHTTQARREAGNTLQNPTPKGSPEPRYRLRSGSQGITRRPNRTSANTLEPLTPNTFFSLETGVYVPTQDQRDQFGDWNTDSEPIFDDTVYACLSQAANSPFVNNWNFFEESETYWKPASHSSALYEQLSRRKYREILRKQIEITGHLGSGQFGKVVKGVWHTDQGDLDIAVKMLNNKASEKDTVRFLQEAAIMGQFKHPNIVRLHGVVTVGNPVMMVLELMRNGDLRNYLKSLRPVPGEMVPGNLPRRLLDFCSQIALGMEYLSRKYFIHRDLATRNILLTEDYVCKIADFGMSRDLDDEDYYMSEGGMIPIKWTAPEALNYRKYSTASDVWSFGVLVYEVWSLGHTPFKNKTPEETISLVESGYRLPPPPGCPRVVYHLMISCWHPDHSSRPTFTKVVQALSQSEEVLLHWTSDDSSIHTQIASLGAPLKIGEKLYPELWKMYTSTA